MNEHEQAIAVLRAIVAEVAGHEPAFSANSYLPPHLIHDARKVIEDHDAREVIKEHEQAIARRQHEDSALLLPPASDGRRAARCRAYRHGRSAAGKGIPT
ncbi:MAG: hypothetical protein IPK44_24680 [Candidatus Accumulibacter sp.]|uniref:hypothetical protein n=1 Tax=Accumulibacter sp. TaxID=2053492 RepID=UPI00258D7337|nr:hypothetical protein [Accumulibacter sp.]MBK8117485.1 hypothetical protein [Accumulibacter sp.]